MIIKSFVGNFGGCCLHVCESFRPLASSRRLRDMPSPPCHSLRSQTVRQSPLASDRVALWPDTCRPSWFVVLSSLARHEIFDLTPVPRCQSSYHLIDRRPHRNPLVAGDSRSTRIGFSVNSLRHSSSPSTDSADRAETDNRLEGVESSSVSTTVTDAMRQCPGWMRG